MKVNYWARVRRDTLAAAGGRAGLVGLLGFPTAGAVAHYLRDGPQAMSAEMYIWALYVGGPLVLYLAAVVAWNMASAPYKIERDRADAATIKIAALESGAQLPHSVLKSLSESQARSDALDQQLVAIALLMEQYRRLLSATRQMGNFDGTNLADDDLTLISRFLAEQTKTMLPPLPFRPEEPLIFQIGWNEFRYIFNVPTSRPPDVSFPELPPGITAKVVQSGKIYCDVRFHHGPTNNRSPIPPQAVFFNARLA